MTEENTKTEETASLTEPLRSREPDVGNVAAALGDAYHADGLSGAYYLEASDSLARVNARLEAVRAYASRMCAMAHLDSSTHGRALLDLVGGQS